MTERGKIRKKNSEGADPMDPNDSICWQQNNSRDSSPKQSASSSHTSSPTRGDQQHRFQRASTKRSVHQRQKPSSCNSTSPLHVAALFASAAKAAVIGGTDSALIRDDGSMSRMFMNADEVFKMWEENMRLAGEEEGGGGRSDEADSAPKGGGSGGGGVRKNASMHERGTMGRRRQILQKAQSTDVVAEQTQLISKGSLKLSTGSMPSDRLDVLSQRPHRSSSVQQQYQSSQQALSEPLKRHFSGVGIRNAESEVGMVELKKATLDNDYTLLRELGTGRFGVVQLAEHKQSRQKVALKLFARPATKQLEFLREYQLARFLSPHPNILDTFEGCFETDDGSAFFFVQECVAGQICLRDMLTNQPGGLSEQATKLIMLKVLSALEFLHNEGIVHRNIRAESVVIMDTAKLTRVKLTDFGLTRPAGSMVRHQETVNSYHGPELCDKVINEGYTVASSVDIWAWGILMVYCMKGKFPWQKATIMCKPYWEWDQWLKRKMPQLPKYWDLFSEKALKLFKHSLNPKTKERWEAREMRKFVEKERMLKSKATDEEMVYYPEPSSSSNSSSGGTNSAAVKGGSEEQKQQQQPKKSVIGQWINQLNMTMSEISEQVVSARDDD